jgi:hypothetical protein
VNSDIRTRSQKRHQLYESVVEIRQVEGSRHVL